MKKILLSIISVLSLSANVLAQDLDPDLQKPMLYTVEIQDSAHKLLFSTNTNNLSNKSQAKSVDNSFIDNCIKNKGIVESTKGSVQTGFNVSFGETSGVASSMVIHISKLVDKKQINTGECNIEEAIIGSTTITQDLPFITFENKFHLKDKSGQELPEVYYLKVSGKKLKLPK